MEETIELKYPCGICDAISAKKCSSCCKISYCSVEHQREDWMSHKSKCRQFPIEYKRINDGGKNILTAFKKILSGQLIFQETSLISGPFLRLLVSQKSRANGYDLKPTCLSCYKEMNSTTRYSCSNCGWAVCDSTCEKEKIHADFECKIFAEKNIKALELKTERTEDGRDIYSMITVLRTLLLRDTEPEKWIQILNLYSYPILRQINPWRQNFQKLVVKFIRDTCGLSGFDENTIARVGGIITFNSRGNEAKDHWIGSQTPRTASFLFHDFRHLSMVNGRPVNIAIHQTEINKYERQVQVYAKGNIGAGEELNFTHADYFAVIRTGPPVQFRSATSPRLNSGLEEAIASFKQVSNGGFFDNEHAEDIVRQSLDGPKGTQLIQLLAHIT